MRRRTFNQARDGEALIAVMAKFFPARVASPSACSLKGDCARQRATYTPWHGYGTTVQDLRIRGSRDDLPGAPGRGLAALRQDHLARAGCTLSFPGQIFQALAGAGLVTSTRGVRGGVALSRPAGKISLYDIVIAVDGDRLFSRCLLGLPGCNDKAPCPIHETWALRRRQVRRMFERVTLADLADKGRRI